MPADIHKQLEIIAEGGHRVKNIVKRLLTFARQSKPVKSVTNINELIEATLALRSYVLRTANIKVVKHLDPDLPLMVVDPTQAQQVFLNIIVNAEWSMKKAHGKGTLTITTQKKGDLVRISLEDDGLGISPENKEKLFKPFFTTKEVGEGTGLGLSLSRTIVLEHGGTIEVESEPGKGANFIITLPLDTQMGGPGPGQNPQFINVSPENFRPASILVIDDEDPIRSLLSTILVQNGHSVDVTGEAGKALSKIDNKHYDAVLIDIRMPGTGGIELYNEIISKHPDLTGECIFITGNVSDSSLMAFLERNGLEIVTKPFEREDLICKVNAVLAR